MNYFNKFPLVSYDGQTAVNLLARAALPNKVKNDKTVFFDYMLAAEDRVDVLSKDYYDSHGYSWLIWHANDTIDPYYDFAIEDTNLMNHIEAKYGSLLDAQSKIAFYRANWYGDLRRITVAEWEELPLNYAKYWSPYLDQYGRVAGYERAKTEMTINTNQIVTIGIADASGSFTVGEKVSIDAFTYGYVTCVDASSVTIQHIRGDFSTASNVGGTLTGYESGTTATVVSSNVIVSTDAWNDALYWEAVSLFDYEMERNERKRSIKLINNFYTGQIENELKRVMKQA